GQWGIRDGNARLKKEPPARGSTADGSGLPERLRERPPAHLRALRSSERSARRASRSRHYLHRVVHRATARGQLFRSVVRPGGRHFARRTRSPLERVRRAAESRLGWRETLGIRALRPALARAHAPAATR